MMRSKQAFAYSRSTGYFCSVCSGSLAPCCRGRTRRAGACHPDIHAEGKVGLDPHRGQNPTGLARAPRFGARRHRVEAAPLALPLWPVAALGQEQESKAPGLEAGGRGSVDHRDTARTERRWRTRQEGGLSSPASIVNRSSPDRPPVFDLDQCSFRFMSAFDDGGWPVGGHDHANRQQKRQPQ